jgi:hypothetical protein
MDNELKLDFMVIPRTAWGRNARTTLPKEEWDRLRTVCYQRAGYICEICGGAGPAHPVECHEEWEFIVETKTQRLAALIALCPRCHKVKHIMRSMMVFYAEGHVEEWRKVVQHFCTINKCDEEVFRKRFMDKIWRPSGMNKVAKWTLDLSILKNFDDEGSAFIIGGFDV